MGKQLDLWNFLHLEVPMPLAGPGHKKVRKCSGEDLASGAKVLKTRGDLHTANALNRIRIQLSITGLPLVENLSFVKLEKIWKDMVQG